MIKRLQALLPQEHRRSLHVYLVLVACGTAVRGAACVTLIPLVRELFSDDASGAWPWVGVLTITTVLGWVIDLTATRRGQVVGRRLMYATLFGSLDRLGAVPIGWFTPERSSTAQRTLSSVGQTLYSAMSNLVSPVLTATLLPYAIALFLLPISWPVGLVALACAPLLQLAHAGARRLLRGADERFTAAGNDVDQRVVEFARNQPVLRASGRAGAEGTALGAAFGRMTRASLGLLGWAVPGQLVFSVASQITLLALAAITVNRWDAGALSVPETIATFVVIVRYLEAFTEVSDLAPAVENLRNMVRRTTAILEAPLLPVAASTTTLDTARGDAPSIEFDDVHFAHRSPGGDTHVLRGVSFAVAAGTTTAIVGPSGAGKTTILSLVARFVDVERGAVRVGDVDVTQLDPIALLASTGVVFQDVYLFEGSIRDNIRHGRPDATDAEIEAAAGVARVDEIVRRLPDGWETRVGEGGTALSGGERQRVSLARALVKDTSLLLLDEATSAIDTENEAAILGALEARDPRRTVLVVAHRRTTIERASQVLFIDGGRVVESGTPAELLALGGRFATFWADREASDRWTIGASPPARELDRSSDI